MNAAKVWKNRARNHYKRLYGHGKGSSGLGTTLHHLFNSRAWTCPYTGQVLSLSNVSLDHIQPLSRGGTNSLSNLWFISKYANQEKQNLTWKEYNSDVQPIPLSNYL